MSAGRRGPLEPDVAALLQLLRAAGRPPFDALTVAQARDLYLAGRDTVQLSTVPIHQVVDRPLGKKTAIRARWYEPHPRAPAVAAPAMLFFHGGGGVMGDLDTHDSICRRLAVASNRSVVAIDYRLGPEHRFPAAAEDAIAAYTALVEDAPAWGIDRGNIVLAGDSAGGSLALVVALAVRPELPPPVALVLFYPVTDWRGGTASYAEVDGVPTTRRTMKWFSDHYLSSPADADDWRASPLLAASLANLPPTFVTSAGHDPLCDEAFDLVERLRGSGVRCEHRHLPGQIHGYLTLGRLIGEAQRSIDAAALFTENCRLEIITTPNN